MFIFAELNIIMMSQFDKFPYRRCRIVARKSDMLKALNSLHGQIMNNGEEVLSLDVIVGGYSDDLLRDCVIYETQSPSEFGNPKKEWLRFRTIENYRLYRARNKQLYDAKCRIVRSANSVKWWF